MSIASSYSTIYNGLKEAWEAVLELVPDEWPEKNTANLIWALNKVKGRTWETITPVSSSPNPTLESATNELKENLKTLYYLCEARHATIPAQPNYANLAATIRSINPWYREESEYGVVYIGTYNRYQPYRLTATGWGTFTQDLTAIGGDWPTRTLQYNNGDGVGTIQATVDNVIIVDTPTNDPGTSHPGFLAGLSVRRVTYNPSLPALSNIADRYCFDTWRLREVNFPPLDGPIGQNCFSYIQNIVDMAITVKSTASFTVPAEAGFMRGCHGWTGPLIVESGTNAPTDITTLSAVGSTYPMYSVGVTVQGEGAAGWKESLPNGVFAVPGTTYYRNLK